MHGKIVRWHGAVQLFIACLLALTPTASNAAASEPQVVVRTKPDGFEHAHTDEAMAPLYRDNLDPDLAPHKGRGKQYKLWDIHSTVQKLLPLKYFKHNTLVVIKGGKVYTAPFTTGVVPSPTPRRIARMRETLEAAVASGVVVLPECVFIMNTWDEPRCPVKHPHKCDAPVLSLIKQWDSRSKESLHTDILVPFFNHVYEDVVDYPWERKTPKALMRAAMQNGMPPNCTRLWLTRLGSTPEGRELLDAGITNNLKEGMRIDLVAPVPMADHAKWKFLLATDGFTASCRFGKLLGINSVVLKEETRWIEFYYRSVLPGKHYIGFTKQSAWQVIQSLPKYPDSELRAIAGNAQAFQQKFLSNHSKVLYMRRALQEYVKLFDATEMSHFISSVDTSRLQDLEYVLTQLNAS